MSRVRWVEKAINREQGIERPTSERCESCNDYCWFLSIRCVRGSSVVVAVEEKLSRQVNVLA